MLTRVSLSLSIIALFTLSACSTFEDYSAAKEFADETVRAVVTGWDQDVLLDRFAEPALEGISDDEIAQVFETYRRVFGAALAIEQAEGQVKTQSRVGTDGSGSATVGVFVAPIDFERLDGEAVITVQKFEPGWFVTDFRIRSTSPAETDSTSTEESVETLEV